MATFNVEDAAFAGAGLLARKPGSVIVWALVWAGSLLLITAPFAGQLTSLFLMSARGAGRLNAREVLPLYGSLVAWGLLIWLVSICVGAVVQSAVIRAVLRPEGARAAYLRLGSEESCVLAVNFVKGLIFMGFRLLAGVVSLIVTGLAATGGAKLGAIAYLIANLGSVALVAWIALRLSLAAPISFSERRFRLIESWTLTRGQDLRLLGAGVIVTLIVAVIYLVALCIGVVGGFSLVGGGPGSAPVQNLLSLPADQAGRLLAPALTLLSVLTMIAGALITPIALAPWAHIYRSLTTEAPAQPSAA